jgi:hypothetical protein
MGGELTRRPAWRLRKRKVLSARRPRVRLTWGWDFEEPYFAGKCDQFIEPVALVLPDHRLATGEIDGAMTALIRIANGVHSLIVGKVVSAGILTLTVEAIEIAFVGYHQTKEVGQLPPQNECLEAISNPTKAFILIRATLCAARRFFDRFPKDD